MRSRQYIINLTKVKKVHSYRVYADRSVETGFLENGEFIRSSDLRPQIHTRAHVADLISMAREFGYDVQREWL